ncbi:hypothetical protein AAG906_002488 [Vitis piasezkii]
MESIPPVVTKKLLNTVRIVLFMLRKGLTKSKLMIDLRQIIMKCGKILGKEVSELMLRHHTTLDSLSCRSRDLHMSFVSPHDYEFSCSNSPAYPFHLTKRKAHFTYTFSNRLRHHYARYHAPTADNDVAAVTVVKTMLEMLSGDVAASPLMGAAFGRSPVAVRQLRVTDSPFPLKDDDVDCHVDKAADEFIERFYKELRRQKWKAAREAAYYYG